MKQLICLLLLFFFGAANSLSAERVYVTAEALPSGSGKKWTRSITLHRALLAAKPGDEIWVKAGLYRTSPVGDRGASFNIPAGVHIYGGFSGKEIRLRQRPAGSKSTLSGELGKAHDASDNAYTVVQLHASGYLSTTIDGFSIVGGNSQTFTEGFAPRNAGGGMYVHNNQTNTVLHQVRNCTFEDNKAHHGGAVYVRGGRTSFTNCFFVANDADFYGGAVYNDGERGRSNPVFQQCSFIDNASNSGGGLANNGFQGEASPELIGCKFADNVSLINGAAIFNILKDHGRCEPMIEDCTFIGNESILGDNVSKFGKGNDGGAAVEPHKQGGVLKPMAVKRR